MRKAIVSLLLMLGGAAIFVLGNPYYAVFPTNGNQTYYVALALFFLVLSAALRRSRSLSRYWPAAYALFIASAALLLLNAWIVNLERFAVGRLQSLALDKLSQSLHVVPVIVGLTLLAKHDLKAIFISKGRLRQGLAFGLLSFVAWTVLAVILQSVPVGVYRSPGATVPWILLFVFANAIMEELWFRGIFLKPYERVVGRHAAVLVTSAVFGVSHVFATYDFPGGGNVFGLVVFVLGLVSAYAMLKHDSLIGPVLFHAGYDLLVIGSVLNS